MRRKLIAFMAMVALCGAAFGQGGKEAALDGTAASNGLGKKLVVYSTQTDPDIEVVVGGFEKTYGIDVEVINGSAGELRSRIASEAGNPQADVMWGGLSQSDGNVYADLFEPYVSPLNEELYEEYRSDNGFYNYPNVQLVNLIVNTDLAAKLGVEINGYEDLLDPRLKGKIICADPTSSSSAWRHLTTMLLVMGGYGSQASWDYIEQLMANMDGIMSGSSSYCYKSVADGEYVVGLSYEDGDAQLVVQGAPNIKLVYMKEGTTGCAFGGAVVKGAKHMAAAKAFIDYMLSVKCQEERNAKLHIFRSTNKKVAFDATYIPSYDSIVVKHEDYAYLAAHKQEIKDRWTSSWSRISGRK